MQGKTTFILRDKDTGKIVDEREEHNMVTNALRDIFNFPRTVVFTTINSNIMTNYLPLHKNLLRGLVLFGDNIPERKDDYFIHERYSVTGTAGSAYTGTDPKRGTFNESASGVIENGYRFVWDFAPEKAIGTIKCAGLSNLHSGNRGSAFSTGATFANALDLTNSSVYRLNPLSGSAQGSYMMRYGDDLHYYYQLDNSTTNMTIYKFRAPDPDALHINTSATIELLETKAITVPHRTSRLFVGEKEKKAYIFDFYSSGSQKVEAKVAALDIATYNIELLTEQPIETPIARTNYVYCYGAFFNGQVYVSFNSDLYVYDLDGTLKKQYKLLVSSVMGMFIKDDKLWMCARYSVTQTPCYVVIEDEPIYLPNISAFENFQFRTNKNIHDPYVMGGSGQVQNILLRTDYLATINNLNEPIEKTDQHALQVRYEITE